MSGISHKQAMKWINHRLDGLITHSQALQLDEHLDSCDTCSAYAAEITSLPAHLQDKFRARWDHQLGPSQKVRELVTAKARRFPLRRRVSAGVKLMTSASALLVLAFLVNLVVSQLQNTSTPASETETADNFALPENRLLAFASDQTGNSDVYIMRADGSGRTNLTNDPAFDGNPFWSPNGKQIAFVSDRSGSPQIYLMDADGSNTIQLTNIEGDAVFDSNGYSPWSPDGTKLIFINKLPEEQYWRLYVLNVNEKTSTALTKEVGGYVRPSWSPDGEYIAFLYYESEARATPHHLFILDKNGNNLTELTEPLRIDENRIFLNFDYYWSQDGTSVFFTTNNTATSTLYEAHLNGSLTNVTEIDGFVYDRWNGITLQQERKARMLTWLHSDGSQATLDLCLNGDQPLWIAYQRSSQGNSVFGTNCPVTGWVLYWANPDGTITSKLLEGMIPAQDDGLYNITWSADDRFLAFLSLDSDASNLVHTLYVLDIEQARNNPAIQPLKLESSYSPSWQPVIHDELVEENPTPTPTQDLAFDGLIAFTSDQNGNSDIYTMRADGSGLTNLTNNPAQDSNPIWSPDGKDIAFQSYSNGFTQIYLMNADGSNLMQLTNDNADHSLSINLDGKSNPWSPDGKNLLILQSSSGGEIWHLYVIGINGENKILLASGRFSFNSVSWSPDGKHIAYVLNEASNPNQTFETGIYVMDSDGSNSKELRNYISQDKILSAPYYWSADGQSIIFMARSGESAKQGMIYEFNLDGETLLEKSTLAAVVDWQNDVSLTWEKDFVWHRSDGNTNTLPWNDPCLTDITRSSHGNFAIGAYCPDSHKFKFYWTNADGSVIKQLLDSPESPIIGEIGDIAWSWDDRYVAFTIATDKTSLYILNIEDALKNPSLEPQKLVIGSPDLLYAIPSWQPVANNEFFEENLTLEPTLTAPPESLPPIGTAIENGEWIAFIGGEMIPNPADLTAPTLNYDVYTIHPDGSGLTNLTQFPAHYHTLQWSPNGQSLLFMRENPGRNSVTILRHFPGLETGYLEVALPIVDPDHYGFSWSPNSDKIVFANASSGNYDIYTVYADGRFHPELTQLTNDPADDVGFVWSPDGRQIAYQRSDGEKLSIMVMDADGSNQHEVARGMGRVKLHWSMDRLALYASPTYLLGDMQYSHLECEACVAKPAIYRIDLNGPSTQQIYYEEDSIKVFYLYETPQDTLYFMSIQERNASVALWGTWMYWDGNSVHEIGEMNPQQTCKATEGNILNESISPNPRFSVITNFCAGGFDLYLADREAVPEKRFTHLLQLPLDTWGQGGDSATLPMGWSPDGRWLIYETGPGTMMLLNIERAIQDPEAALAPVIELSSLTGPDGQLYQSPENLTFFGLVWQPRP